MRRFLSVLLCAALALMLLPAISQAASAESVTKFNISLNKPVASYNPDFSLEFNTNATVYSSVTWQENSPGFSAKLNSNDEFRAGLAYKVEIWILLGDGNYFPVDGYGDLATAITVNGKAISSLKIEDRNDQNQITEVTITCEYDPLPGMVISSVLVKGVPTPVAGNMPIYSFTLGSSNSYGFYHTEPVVWNDKTSNKQLSSSDTFIQGHKYQLSIWLYANRGGGFTFKTDQNGNPQVSATINSWAADKVLKAYEQDGREVIELLYTFPTCQAAHTHTPSGWRTTQAYHYKVCTACGDMLDQADHTGGRATCAEQGKCDVCDYAYLETTEDHTPDTSKWVARAEQYHFHKCTLCGAHCDVEDHRWSPKRHAVDATGHAYQCADCKGYDVLKPHVPGPAATDDTPQTCKECGYIITPAKNHTHNLLKAEAKAATCRTPGSREYYTCDGCNQWWQDAAGTKSIADKASVVLPALGHFTGEQWAYDEETHWQSCVVCAQPVEEGREKHGDSDNDGKCDRCGYHDGAEIGPETTQPQPATPPPGTEEKPNGPSWLLLVLVALASFAAAVTVTVIIMKKKK